MDLPLLADQPVLARLEFLVGLFLRQVHLFQQDLVDLEDQPHLEGRVRLEDQRDPVLHLPVLPDLADLLDPVPL